MARFWGAFESNVVNCPPNSAIWQAIPARATLMFTTFQAVVAILLVHGKHAISLIYQRENFSCQQVLRISSPPPRHGRADRLG
jgi:hypothetical protein